MVTCTKCKGEFSDECVYDWNDHPFCKGCANLLVEDAIVGQMVRNSMPDVYHGMLAEHYNGE